MALRLATKSSSLTARKLRSWGSTTTTRWCCPTMQREREKTCGDPRKDVEQHRATSRSWGEFANPSNQLPAEPLILGFGPHPNRLLSSINSRDIRAGKIFPFEKQWLPICLCQCVAETISIVQASGVFAFPVAQKTFEREVGLSFVDWNDLGIQDIEQFLQFGMAVVSVRHHAGFQECGRRNPHPVCLQ